MAKEKDIIKLEKTIISKMLAIRTKKLTPAESGIGKVLNLMKGIDEPLWGTLMEKYKKTLIEIKNEKL